MSEPCTVSAVSACASKWTTPTAHGHTWRATAAAAGYVIDWSPPSTTGIGPALATRNTLSWITRRARAWRDGTTGASPESTTVRRSYGSTSSWIDHASLPHVVGAERIARGPKRAPGLPEVPSSVGAPTIATSAPLAARLSSSEQSGSLSNVPRTST
jgi:hypothetical protein